MVLRCSFPLEQEPFRVRFAAFEGARSEADFVRPATLCHAVLVSVQNFFPRVIMKTHVPFARFSQDATGKVEIDCLFLLAYAFAEHAAKLCAAHCLVSGQEYYMLVSALVLILNLSLKKLTLKMRAPEEKKSTCAPTHTHTFFSTAGAHLLSCRSLRSPGWNSGMKEGYGYG